MSGLYLLMTCVWLCGCSPASSDNQVKLDSGYEPASPIVFPVPEIGNIEQMEARITLVENDEVRKVAFVVPKEHYESIFDAVNPARVDPAPMLWMVLGDLKLNLKSGETFRIDLFWLSSPNERYSTKDGAFSAGRSWEERTYYRGGSSAALESALRAAYDAAMKE